MPIRRNSSSSRKKRTSRSKKKKTTKSKSRKRPIHAFVGAEDDIDHLSEAIMADLGDLLVVPQVVRWIKSRRKLNDLKREALEKGIEPEEMEEYVREREEHHNTSAKGILEAVSWRGGATLLPSIGLPLSIAFRVLSIGSNTKLFIERNREKIENDEAYQNRVLQVFLKTIDKITTTPTLGKQIKNIEDA